MTAEKYTVVVLKEGDRWSAQLVEHDICGQGDTYAAALTSLANTMLAEETIVGFEKIPPAPSFYRRLTSKE